MFNHIHKLTLQRRIARTINQYKAQQMYRRRRIRCTASTTPHRTMMTVYILCEAQPHSVCLC